MRAFLLLLFASVFSYAQQKDHYDLSRYHYNNDQLDSARFYINKNLTKKPSADDYFLSGLIHEAENKDLRALADYEAVIKKQPDNLEAYFQKGLIYYESASVDQSIKDFTYVIENQSGSETKAVYYGFDPLGAKGTFLTTLQSMIGRVYQYRGMAYQKSGQWDLALEDFTKSFEYDSSADSFINRSQLYTKMNREGDAIKDLRTAISIEPDSYLAWYNLALLDELVQLPQELVDDEEFSPMLNLVGANAYESENYELSAQYYTKSLEVSPSDELAWIGRGKALIRTGATGQARQDFMKALQLNSSRSETLYLIGNALFHERRYKDAIGFYEQYLSQDPGYANVWFNAAMSYLSLKENVKACNYLEKAKRLGMDQAVKMSQKYCNSQ